LAEAFNSQTGTSQPAQQVNSNAAHNLSSAGSQSPEGAKLRGEIARMDLLIKKLQTELQLERQYIQSLEQQIQSLLRGT
jgi:hypothetical protein